MTWPQAASIPTPRLELEPLRDDHADEMVSVLADPELYVFTGGEAPSRETLQRRYAAQTAGQSPDSSQGWLNWIVRRREDAAAIGYVQATLEQDADEVTANVAWVIAPAYQRRGYASEAAAAMIQWLTAQGVHSFAADVHPGNRASNGVAQRLGFHATDVVVDGEVRWERLVLAA